MEDREFMGVMHIVRRHECGHVFAACWVSGNEEDAASFKRRHQRKGNKVETIERYKGDPQPDWCSSSCRRSSNG